MGKSDKRSETLCLEYMQDREEVSLASPPLKALVISEILFGFGQIGAWNDNTKSAFCHTHITKHQY